MNPISQNLNSTELIQNLPKSLPKKATTKKAKKEPRKKNSQEIGAYGEGLITSSLRASNIWNHKFINAGYGTIADKIVIPPGGGFLLEIKTRDNPSIEYSKISKNEREGLDDFMKKVGKSHSLIIGIWKTAEIQRAFLIPWCQARDGVLSGKSGSIKMLDFPELRKISGGWNLECLGEVNVNEGFKIKN